jgi:hypothetical protein
MGCCTSNTIELYKETLLIRRRDCADLTKVLIPYDKIVFIRKSHTYTWTDVLWILLTVGLYYFFCIESGLEFSLSNGEFEYSGPINKSYASEKFRDIATKVFKNEDADHWNKMNEDDQPQSPRPQASRAPYQASAAAGGMQMMDYQQQHMQYPPQMIPYGQQQQGGMMPQQQYQGHMYYSNMMPPPQAQGMMMMPPNARADSPSPAPNTA